MPQGHQRDRLASTSWFMNGLAAAILPHSKKGYSLDLLFGSASFCRHVSVSDSLVAGDPDHHECSFFRVSSQGTSPCDCESKNKTKNFAEANIDEISAGLDLNWNNLLEPDIDEGVNRFYYVLNGTIERNIPDCKSMSDSFPIWYTNEHKALIHKKKELPAIWMQFRLTSPQRL